VSEQAPVALASARVELDWHRDGAHGGLPIGLRRTEPPALDSIQCGAIEQPRPAAGGDADRRRHPVGTDLGAYNHRAAFALAQGLWWIARGGCAARDRLRARSRRGRNAWCGRGSDHRRWWRWRRLNEPRSLTIDAFFLRRLQHSARVALARGHWRRQRSVIASIGSGCNRAGTVEIVATARQHQRKHDQAGNESNQHPEQCAPGRHPVRHEGRPTRRRRRR